MLDAAPQMIQPNFSISARLFILTRQMNNVKLEIVFCIKEADVRNTEVDKHFGVKLKF